MSIEHEHINQPALAELKSIMEDDFVLLVETFLTDSDMRISTLKSALSAKDAKLFAETAHSFKGSSLNVCATYLSDLCQSLESMGRDNQLDKVSETLAEAEAEYNQVATLLKSLS